jgi:hypothetical protein
MRIPSLHDRKPNEGPSFKIFDNHKPQNASKGRRTLIGAETWIGYLFGELSDQHNLDA